MGCNVVTFSGLIFNDSNTSICYSISSEILALQSKDVETTVGAKIQGDFSAGPSGNLNGQYKTVQNYKGKQIKSLVVLRPKSFSTIGLLVKQQERLNIWMGTAEQIKQVLIRDVLIKKTKDIRLKVLPSFSIVPLDQHQYRQMASGQQIQQKQSWSGYYSQFGERHRMFLENLIFSGDLIFGNGMDQIGKFSIKGGVEQNRFQFVKHYIGQHSIYYAGEFNRELLQLKGYWGFKPNECEEHFQLRKD